MDEIEKQRKIIDEAHAEIVAAIAKRTQAARIIGKIKKISGKPIRDKKREESVLSAVESDAMNLGIDPTAVKSIFQKIIDESVSMQERTAGTLFVSFQGELGAYSEQAVQDTFPGCVSMPCETVEDAIKAVKHGIADRAVLPVENSLEGPVVGLHDLLPDCELVATGEIFLPIRHCLMALPGTKLEDVSEVISHPQALGQCKGNLAGLVPQAKSVPFYDTAGAAKEISRKRLQGIAAIASARAAEIYGLEILKIGLQDDDSNTTRFLAFSKEPDGKVAEKTSVVFSVQHRPGALASCLEPFASLGINITRIESRPSRKTPWEYLFYLDFEQGEGSPLGKEVVRRLKDNARWIKVIGSYPKGLAAEDFQSNNW